MTVLFILTFVILVFFLGPKLFDLVNGSDEIPSQEYTFTGGDLNGQVRKIYHTYNSVTKKYEPHAVIDNLGGWIGNSYVEVYTLNSDGLGYTFQYLR